MQVRKRHTKPMHWKLQKSNPHLNASSSICIIFPYLLGTCLFHIHCKMMLIESEMNTNGGMACVDSFPSPSCLLPWVPETSPPMHPSWHLSADSLIADASCSLGWFSTPKKCLAHKSRGTISGKFRPLDLNSDHIYWLSMILSNSWMNHCPFQKQSVSEENQNQTHLTLSFCSLAYPSALSLFNLAWFSATLALSALILASSANSTALAANSTALALPLASKLAKKSWALFPLRLAFFVAQNRLASQRRVI